MTLKLFILIVEGRVSLLVLLKFFGGCWEVTHYFLWAFFWGCLNFLLKFFFIIVCCNFIFWCNTFIHSFTQ